MCKVTGQRAHQQSSWVLGVVRDARHDFRAAESLRILKGCVRNQFTAFEIHESQHNRRSPKVHGDPENWPRGPFHFNSVNQDSISIARDRGVESELPIADGQSERVPLNDHVSAPHGMTANVPLCASDVCLTRQAKIALQMKLRLGKRRKGTHPLNHFDHALFALALLAAGSGHIDAHGFGVVKQRSPVRRLD